MIDAETGLGSRRRWWPSGDTRLLSFMKIRDIGLFIKSARTDARISSLRAAVGNDAAFEAIYLDADPWAASDRRYLYQQRKYDVLDGLLADRTFGEALDIGCGPGHLAAKLARRSTKVLGVDLSQRAVDAAQTNYSALPNLRFARGDIRNLPKDFAGRFDLITIADTLYYLPPPISDHDLKAIVAQCADCLVPGGLLMVCNHFFASFDRDSRVSQRIHDAFFWSAKLSAVSRARRPFYLMSLFERAG